MPFKRIGVMAMLGLALSASGFAAENDEGAFAAPAETVAPLQAWTPPSASTTRPAALPVLYASLGVLQAFDIYSTSRALNAGAREANPISAQLAPNTGAMIGIKAAATAGTIFFAERLWRKNKVAAVVLMASINGATAAVSMHNMRNAGR